MEKKKGKGKEVRKGKVKEEVGVFIAPPTSTPFVSASPLVLSLLPPYHSLSLSLSPPLCRNRHSNIKK
jgi:hypothetical protein